TRRAAATATSPGGRPSAARRRTILRRRSAFTTRTIPAGSLLGRRRKRNDASNSPVQAVGRSGLRHRGFWRRRRRAGQGTFDERIPRGGSRARALSARKRFHARRNQSLRPEPVDKPSEGAASHLPQNGHGYGQKASRRDVRALRGRQQRAFYGQLLAAARNRFNRAQQNGCLGGRQLRRLADHLRGPGTLLHEGGMGSRRFGISRSQPV